MGSRCDEFLRELGVTAPGDAPRQASFLHVLFLREQVRDL